MKWIKIIVSVILISGVVVIGALVTLPYRMAREIDSRIAAIKAQGDPVSGKGFVPHVPDSQNSALIYEQVFKITEPGKDYIAKSYDVTSPLKLLENPGLLIQARKTSEKYRSVLPLIDQASIRPQCRFDTNWDASPELIIYPYLSKVRNVSQLLAQIAVIDAIDGKMENIVKEIGLGYRLGESIREEPTLISFITRVACISISSGSLKRSAQYGNISESQAYTLFNLLGKINLKSDYVSVVKGERAYGLDIMERVRHHYLSLPSLLALGDSQSKPVSSSPSGSGISSRLLDIRSSADELFFMKYMDRVVDASNKPYHDRIARQVEQEPDFPKYAIASVIVMPAFSKSKQMLYEAMSTVAGDRVFLAVLAYKSKFSNYPASLDDVTKKLDWKLPLDPMVDKQFHYRRKGKGFILYGVGRNMKDDNAQTIEDPSQIIRKASWIDISGKYPYSNHDGRRSADMIWEMSR